MIHTMLIDLDGTVADATHRLHFIQQTPKQWDTFYEHMTHDTPIEPVISVIESVFWKYTPNVYIVTGRPERYREETLAWLDCNCNWGPYKGETVFNVTFDKLLMRKDKDYRPDFVVKHELTSWLPSQGYQTVLVFEDRTRNVQMWRSRGYTVFQTAEGDY